MTASIGTCALTACLHEVMARKPGNVHPGRDFHDLTLMDFIKSAIAIAPHLEQAPGQSLGKTILACAQSTHRVCKSNSNLGIILLLAPLATASNDSDLRVVVANILNETTLDDSRATFEAIRLLQPGGLGNAAKEDVHSEPTLPLQEIMTLAADRDLIARQYANGFEQIFDEGVPVLVESLKDHTIEQAVLACYLHLFSRHPDSLILRKRGTEEAQEASQHARKILNAGWKPDHGWTREIQALDDWLTEEGHSRNPGTTADLIAACLYVALREGKLGFDHPMCDE